VTARNQKGNTIASFDDTLHFVSSDAHAGLPADVALTNGTGTFSATLNTTGGQFIGAMATGKPGVFGRFERDPGIACGTSRGDDPPGFEHAGQRDGRRHNADHA